VEWENALYRLESAWYQLAQDFGGPWLIGLGGCAVIIAALIVDIKNRNRTLRVLRHNWHCVDPRFYFDSRD